MDIESTLSGMDLQLPAISTPGGNYVSVNIRGSIAYVAIQFPIRDGEFLYRGLLGDTISTAEGREAIELCALKQEQIISALIYRSPHSGKGPAQPIDLRRGRSAAWVLRGAHLQLHTRSLSAVILEPIGTIKRLPQAPASAPRHSRSQRRASRHAPGT